MPVALNLRCKGFHPRFAADALRAISAARPAIAVKARLIGFLLSRFTRPIVTTYKTNTGKTRAVPLTGDYPCVSRCTSARVISSMRLHTKVQGCARVLALLFKSRARLEAEIPTPSRRKKRPRCSEARFLPFNSGFGTAEVAAFLPSGKTIRERRDRSDTFRPNFAGGGSKEEARPWQSGRPRSCGGSNQLKLINGH